MLMILLIKMTCVNKKKNDTSQEDISQGPTILFVLHLFLVSSVRFEESRVDNGRIKHKNHNYNFEFLLHISSSIYHEDIYI